MNVLSSALAQALVPLASDLLLVWNYGVVAVLAGAGGVFFLLDNRKIDANEHELNLLPTANFRSKEGDVESNDEGVVGGAHEVEKKASL